MKPFEAFPLVDISGSARERGRQYGEQAHDRVGKSALLTGKGFIPWA